MTGSGPDDNDLIEMGPEKPPRTWVVGRGTRLALAVAGGCALLAVGATLAAVRLTAPASPALARLITEVTTVPPSTTVPARATGIAGATGSGGAPSYSQSGIFASASTPLTEAPSPTAISGPPLTSGGKPEVLYVSAGYCPYCVAESWPLIVALSRFGAFSGLSTSRSPDFEDVPPLDGWTFYGSSYASRYLAFVPVETHSNLLVSPKADPAKATSYRVLQRLTPAEQAVVGQHDQGRETPFLDFGGRATQTGSDVSSDALVNVTWSQIAADLRRPKSPVGMTIVAAAGTLTAEFCQLTGDRPAAACQK
jgi:Domain of unknown function (DUF929)